VKRLFLVTALAALVGGCVVGGQAARQEMEASKAAYKACLATRGPEECENSRLAYEADRSAYRATPKFVIGAGSPPPLSGSVVGMGNPPVMGGQTVYSPNECIGAIVMGQCHGSILPDYSLPHPTCYGQMLNGRCTGPMF
jgi:hypothetical protein